MFLRWCLHQCEGAQWVWTIGPSSEYHSFLLAVSVVTFNVPAINGAIQVLSKGVQWGLETLHSLSTLQPHPTDDTSQTKGTKGGSYARELHQGCVVPFRDSWIFHVLEKAELPEFICRFLRMIYFTSTTPVEFAGKSDGCRTRSFPKTLLRVLMLMIFAVAASSFRLLMTALSLAFVVVDRVSGLNPNHRKCCWVQYGSVSCHEFLNWVATHCQEFREMKIVKCARSVGTMIGPEGYLHRWTAPRKKLSRNQEKRIHQEPHGIDWLTSKSSLGIWCPYPHLMRRLSRERPTAYNASLLSSTLIFLLICCVLCLLAASGSTFLGSIPSVWRPSIERLPTLAHSSKALRKFVQLMNMTVLPSSPFLLNGIRYSWRCRWPTAPWKPMNTCASLGSCWQNCRLSQ